MLWSVTSRLRFADRFPAAARRGDPRCQVTGRRLRPPLPAASERATATSPDHAIGCRPPTQSLLSATEAVDVNDQRLDDWLTQTALPGRHRAAATVIDDVRDRLFLGAVEPDTVGQVGRPQFAVTLAFRSVTGCAVVGKYLLPQCKICARLRGKARWRANKVGHRRNLIGLQHAL